MARGRGLREGLARVLDRYPATLGTGTVAPRGDPRLGGLHALVGPRAAMELREPAPETLRRWRTRVAASSRHSPSVRPGKTFRSGRPWHCGVLADDRGDRRGDGPTGTGDEKRIAHLSPPPGGGPVSRRAIGRLRCVRRHRPRDAAMSARSSKGASVVTCSPVRLPRLLAAPPSPAARPRTQTGIGEAERCRGLTSPRARGATAGTGRAAGRNSRRCRRSPGRRRARASRGAKPPLKGSTP